MGRERMWFVSVDEHLKQAKVKDNYTGMMGIDNYYTRVDKLSYKIQPTATVSSVFAIDELNI
jgi:hypothetical protein